MWPLRPAGKGARSEQVAQTLKDEAIWLDRFGLCEHWREITVPHVFQIEGYIFFLFWGVGVGWGLVSHLVWEVEHAGPVLQLVGGARGRFIQLNMLLALGVGLGTYLHYPYPIDTTSKCLKPEDIAAQKQTTSF